MGRISAGEAGSVERSIEDAVFALMETTPITEIRVGDVIRHAGVSRSTFYRHFRSVDDVVKTFENDLLKNMHSINSTALKTRFGGAEIDPTPTMIRRMEELRRNRDKIVALNGPNGDPTFTHKATVLMHDYFRERLRGFPGNSDELDLYLSYTLAGHHNLIQYWLEIRPDLEAHTVAAMLNRLFYGPFFLDESTVRHNPSGIHLG